MVFSLQYVQTTNGGQQKMQANSWQIRLPCSCGGAMRGTSPDEAHPGLLSKPLNAAIERVLA